MKSLFSLVAFAVIVSACSSEAPAPDSERNVVVSLPTQLSNSERPTVLENIERGLWAADTVRVRLAAIEGGGGREVADGVIPPNGRLSARSRLRYELGVRPFMGLLKSSYEHETRVGDSNADLVLAGEILQQFAGAGTNTAVVVYAPLQRDLETDVEVAIRDNLYPSDGHLFAPPDVSTLSVRGRERRLQGLEVYLVSPPSEPWLGEVGERHKRAVRRFWYWWFSLQGARVRYVGASLEAAVHMAIDSEGDDERLREEFGPPPDAERPGKAEMRTVRDPPPCLDPERTVTSSAPTRLDAGPLMVGITWEGGDIDLDLHARAHSGAPELYFDHVRAPGALFEKRPAEIGETGARGFEWVTFENVNIRDVRLAVNFFEVVGDRELAQGPRGQLRVAFDGRCYVRDFSIRARRGNHGEGRDDPNRGGRPEWTDDLDLPGLVLASRAIP